jgi:hypothetical protein
MTHRTNTVFLPADVTRCAPSAPCAKRHDCRRYMAALPAQGASLTDFSIASSAAFVPETGCTHFWPLWQEPESAQKKPPRPYVDGLS